MLILDGIKTVVSRLHFPRLIVYQIFQTIIPLRYFLTFQMEEILTITLQQLQIRPQAALLILTSGSLALYSLYMVSGLHILEPFRLLFSRHALVFGEFIWASIFLKQLLINRSYDSLWDVAASSTGRVLQLWGLLFLNIAELIIKLLFIIFFAAAAVAVDVFLPQDYYLINNIVNMLRTRTPFLNL